MTYIICYDDHRVFTEDIRKRFSDPERYNVESFSNGQEFVSHLRKVSENKSCKVAIIGVPEAEEQFRSIKSLTEEVKRTDSSTGLVLLIKSEKMEALKRIMNKDIDAYIPRNANTILRVHNTVKRFISEHNISVYRRRRNLSVYILLAFLFLSAIAVLIAYMTMPEYF
jgi:DNA-binding NarL/FixJ family response regulator